MADFRWCIRCQKAFDLAASLCLGRELGCPFCDAGAGNLQTWESVRRHRPHWPWLPTHGKVYRMRQPSVTVRGC